jgi:hypothetical protein
MPSISIQGRIDSDMWAKVKQADETNTEALQRVVAHYLATSADSLQTLTNQPTTETAIAALTTVYNLHQQLMQNAVLAPMSSMPVAAAPAEPATQSKFADDDF